MNVRCTLTNPFEHVFKLLLFFRSDILERPFDQSRQGRLIERWLRSGPPVRGGKLTRPSNVSLDEVRAVWETNVFGVLAVYQAMLPLLREAPAARIVNVSSGVGSLAMNSDPASPWHSIFGPVYPASKTALNAMTLGHRAGVDRDQGQRRLAGLHQDEPQQVCGHGDCRGRRPRGGSLCAARPGRPDRYVHARKTAPVVRTACARVLDETS
jgi:hypothetical protein